MNRYRILREISGGGMGIVYEGRMLFPLSHELPVAIKIIRAEYCEDAKGVEMFAREALTSLRLNHEHPNLVTTYDFGLSPEGRPYMVMALVDGTSLREVAKAGKPGLEHIRRIAWDTLHGLAHLHKHGVLHRDVSPGNILLSRQGAIKLADFGLVKPVDSSQSERFRGTTAYASPEALQGETINERSDLYSLGVVLYELIAGKRPYGSGGPEAIVRKMASAPPDPLPAGTPPDLVELIAGMMEIESRARRFASAVEALGFLDAAGEDMADDAEIGDLVEGWIEAQPGESKWRGLAHTQRSLGNAPAYDRKPRRWGRLVASAAIVVALAATGLVLLVRPADEAAKPLMAEPCVPAESPDNGARASLTGDRASVEAGEAGSVAGAGSGAESEESQAPTRHRRRRAPTRPAEPAAPPDDATQEPKLFYPTPRVERTEWHMYRATDKERQE